ncbi:MAG: helix-turn-helix domain-containing protein, partial [Aestuariivirgaceae bacterium]
HRHGAVKATRLTRLAGKIARNRVATGWYQRRCDCICQQLVATTGHSWSELISKRRSRDLARARQAGMYLLLTHTNMNLPQVGKLFGGRDHSTVVHARNKVTARPGDFADLIETIERQLGVR